MINRPYHPIINHFIKRYDYKSYLELGVRDKTNTYNHILCDNKTGVDIDGRCQPDYVMSTDEFFATVAVDKKWDIIFIDASHEKGQVRKDFNHSLEHLNDNGTIIMDDINPFTAELTYPWHCDNAWEVFAELRGERSDLEMFGIESSFCGVVRRGTQVPHNLTIEPTFEFLDKHRQELINILSWEEICRK